ncbi:MAG TPA: SIMPL domain-containing protein [Dehalococcoidia bacterium]|nr:SIMPL domain-containing protein [Dehalococcoidia bacterium]
MRFVVMGAVSAAVVALGAVACGDTVTQVQPPGQQQTGITVSGEGKATGTPDVGNIQLGVSKLASTVADARSQAAASMSAMIASMKSNGVADKDIQTQQLNIAPEYDFTNNRQTLKGFRVTNIVSAKIRAIDTTSKVVDDAVTAGGNDAQVQGLSFTIDRPESLMTQARQAAVADARAKAETLAKALGVQLGKPMVISESNVVTPIPFAAGVATRDSAAAPSTPIQPGTQDVTVNVSVSWSIQ